MAYSKKELHKKALELIEKYKPHSIKQLHALLGISHNTFYKKFKVGGDEYESIKTAMEEKGAEVVADTIRKTIAADTPSDRAMIMKIYGGDEMRKKLSTNYNEISGEGGGKLSINMVVDSPETGEIFKKMLNGTATTISDKRGAKDGGGVDKRV